MADPDLHRTAAERLRSDGQRYTAARREMVDVLDRTDHPLTIAELLDAGRGLAQSSTYRNLTVLEAAGVVHRVLGADELARFELAEDLAGHHHHLMCSSCGRVVDVDLPPELEDALAAVTSRVERRSGFRVERHRLDLIGRCATCG